jgi:hypothetical protein
MFVRNLLVTAVLAATGCAWHLAGVTSMQIPCSPGDIAISNDRVEAPYRKWDARCLPTGVDYDCSALGSGSSAIIRCARR